MELRRTISVSQVNAYLGCPLKYRFQYVDKLPRPWRVAAMAFGTSIHAAVEWFHKERLAGRSPELPDVLKLFDADWYAQTVAPLVCTAQTCWNCAAKMAQCWPPPTTRREPPTRCLSTPCPRTSTRSSWP